MKINNTIIIRQVAAEHCRMSAFGFSHSYFFPIYFDYFLHRTVEQNIKKQPNKTNSTLCTSQTLKDKKGTMYNTFSTNLDDCQVLKNLVYDPFIEHQSFSNCMLYITSLIQCLYVGGEESFHLYKINLLARSEQKAITSDWDLLRL